MPTFKKEVSQNVSSSIKDRLNMFAKKDKPVEENKPKKELPKKLNLQEKNAAFQQNLMKF